MWNQVKESFRTSLEQMATALAAILPSVLAMALIVVGSMVVAVLVRWLLRRILTRLGFDRLLHRMGVVTGEWPGGRTPTVLAARLGFWTVIVVGFTLGLTAFDAALTRELAKRLLQFLPQVFVALAIFGAGLLVARFLERGSRIAAVNMRLKSASLVSLTVKWLVWVLASAMALEHLGIGGHLVAIAFAILFGGVVLALSLAIGLGTRDAVARAIEKELQKEPAPPSETTVSHM